MWGRHREVLPLLSSLAASTLPTPRSTSGTTTWTSTPSPVTDRYCHLPPYLLHPPLLPTHGHLCRMPPATMSAWLTGSQGMTWESNRLHQVTSPL